MSDSPFIMVIFGGTGDLTHRKLIPAIYNLAYAGRLPQNFAVVAVGRRDKTHESYRDELFQSLRKYSRMHVDETLWDLLREKIYYRRFAFTEEEGYRHLKDFLSRLDETLHTAGNRMFYLAVAPEYFEMIVQNIQKNQMAPNRDSWQRLVIEKPFGKDLETARYLQGTISAVFSEKDTYRIDHYLGKEMIQNIMVIRFANAMFENVWSSKYIDNIQILSGETVGSENRAGYYEASGALRDMIQNHMLQLLALTAMEPPVKLETESIRNEKVKVLRALEAFTPESIHEKVIRGQYGSGMVEGWAVPGYREEDGVAPESDTETYIAMRLQLNNERWGSMPFYLRTGKRLPRKTTEIVVQFKTQPEQLYFKDYGALAPNLLVIRIQPREGVYVQFNGKKPGIGNEIEPVQMDFCQNCHSMNNSPEAYERLIYDVSQGDSTLFTRWDEIEASWRFVDSIAKAWAEDKPHFPNYGAGTWGPEAADELLQKDKRKWWNNEDL